MERSIFKFILKYSKREQLILLCVIVLFYPFLYASLELPKIIVNQAIENRSGGPPFTMKLMGFDFVVELDQITFLLSMCMAYLLLVLINGAFKYYVNVYKGKMGERLLRRFRYQLYARILRFPLTRFRRVGQGELIPMITQEVEPLGGFIGTAFADPLFFGGQLFIILTFIMVQDPFLGAAAIMFYPLQMYLIPKLQRKVNELGKRRIQNVRRLSDHIGESVQGVVAVHANDTSRYELARFSHRLGQIYDTRYEIYRRKFFIKFFNNFIDKLTPFFFFAIGGYLVIQGELTFGALVAVLTAYKDLQAPWKELLVWYQQKEDVRIKYDQVIEQFDLPGMMDETLQRETEGDGKPFEGELAINVGYTDEDGAKILEGAALTVPVRSWSALVGDGASGKTELAMIVARLLPPGQGRVLIGGQDIAGLPEPEIGRRLGYVYGHSTLATGSIRDNLVYGLKRRPITPRPLQGEEASALATFQAEAERAGNSAADFEADWVDYQAAGADSPRALNDRLVDVLCAVDLESEVYQMGLRGIVDPDEMADVAEKVLTARQAFRDRMADPVVGRLVERFDVELYNDNSTVGENMLFGATHGDALKIDELAAHPYVRWVLDEVDLTDDFVGMGRMVAETMVELFADLPPDHEFFQQYSFISSEELPEYQALLDRLSRDMPLADEERDRLMSLAFMLIPERHRLGVIDDSRRQRILEARRVFRQNLPGELGGSVFFFDEASYNPAATLVDNILFGKTSYSQAFAEQRIAEEVTKILDSLDMRSTVILVGTEANVGVGGSRLSHAQRQKVVIARAILKQPDLLVLNEAIESMDQATQNRIVKGVLARLEGRGVFWVMNRLTAPELFDRVVLMKDGRVAEQGDYESLMKSSAGLRRMVESV